MRILVIEDDPKIREFLQKSLKAECYAVDAAETGDEGAHLASINEYDAIVLDNILPHRTGLDICRDIRSQGKSVPILVLSVQDDTNMKVRALNAGADDYLTKPFSLEELVARLHALTRRPAHIVEEVLSSHDISLDSKRHVVTKSLKEVTLTRKEFMLLEYLMQNKGYAVTRAMIMEHVWDMYADPFSNTIESHILSLRRKLKASGGPGEVIETVPGRGYKIS